MDYNKIIKAIKQRDLQIATFIPEVTKLTVQGFRKALSNRTLKVKDLESISKALGLPMDYWWEDGSDFTSIEKRDQEELKKLKERISRQELTIDHLNDQIVELKKRLEGGEKQGCRLKILYRREN